MPTHVSKGKNKNDVTPSSLAVNVATMAANRLYTVWVESSGGAVELSTPSVTSPNLTWDQVGVSVTTGNNARISCFRAMPTGALTNELVTCTWALAQTGATMIVIESDGVASGLNGANAVEDDNTATGTGQSGSISTAAHGDPSHDTLACFLRYANEEANASGDATELDDDFHGSPVRGLIVVYAEDESVSASWTSAVTWSSIAVEIVADGSAGGTGERFELEADGAIELCGTAVISYLEGIQPEPEPPAPSTTTIFIPSIPVESESLWGAFLIDTVTGEKLETVSGSHTGRNRTLDLILNRPGSSSFVVDLDSVEALAINPITTALQWERAGTVVWSGPIWTIQESAAANTMSCTAVGWLQLLNHRLLRTAMSRQAYDSSQFARDLLNATNAIWQTGITIGGMEGGQMITRRFEAWTRVLDALLELSNVENGFDLEVDPVTRELKIWVKRGDARPNAQFGFNREPRNLENVTRSTDSSKTANWVSVVGKIGSAVAEDIPSQVERGLFEDRITLSDVSHGETLLAYAGVEVVLRTQPMDTIEFVPMPTDGEGDPDHIGRVPKPFEDYYLGDTVYVSCDRGRLQLDKQAVRVFRLPITIGETGDERVTSISSHAEGA